MFPSPQAVTPPSRDEFTRQSLGGFLGDKELNQQDLSPTELVMPSWITGAPTGAAMAPGVWISAGCWGRHCAMAALQAGATWQGALSLYIFYG